MYVCSWRSGEKMLSLSSLSLLLLHWVRELIECCYVHVYDYWLEELVSIKVLHKYVRWCVSLTAAEARISRVGLEGCLDILSSEREAENIVKYGSVQKGPHLAFYCFFILLYLNFRLRPFDICVALWFKSMRISSLSSSVRMKQPVLRNVYVTSALIGCSKNIQSYSTPYTISTISQRKTAIGW